MCVGEEGRGDKESAMRWYFKREQVGESERAQLARSLLNTKLKWTPVLDPWTVVLGWDGKGTGERLEIAGSCMQRSPINSDV